MLDFVYYPVSGVLWLWHRIFALPFGADSGLSWALAVVFLVFTLRLALLKPAISQIRTQRALQRLQPHLKAIKDKFPGDRRRQTEELAKLQKEHNVSPLLGCLPALLQAPIFLGLFHVLRSFNRTGTGFGRLGMSANDNASTPNYFFGTVDVHSFLSARLFGAPISAAITDPASALHAFAQFGATPATSTIAAVAIPLMIFAAVATHVNARASIARQSPDAAVSPQSALVNRLSLWVFPIGAVLGGPLLMIAILLYWVANNTWTCVQQHLVFRWLDAHEMSSTEGLSPQPRKR